MEIHSIEAIVSYETLSLQWQASRQQARIQQDNRDGAAPDSAPPKL